MESDSRSPDNFTHPTSFFLEDISPAADFCGHGRTSGEQVVKIETLQEPTQTWNRATEDIYHTIRVLSSSGYHASRAVWSRWVNYHNCQHQNCNTERLGLSLGRPVRSRAFESVVSAFRLDSDQIGSRQPETACCVVVRSRRLHRASPRLRS